ncbi:glutathione synthase [Pseudonocardia endophytica]|uniref:Glutathione synthetase n=1 Tax=Pseudonocardia endophytica TaxID=401976 RepID=A0A4R1HU59_PSEEN|nr:glutathione synthase [Pseudonocardia endophytica]TCK26207.1 glutathione synthase [Pseudonocardia endophytica]
MPHSLRIVIVADPLPDLNPGHDTTVALMEAAQERGHELLCTTAARLRIRDTRTYAACRSVAVVPAKLADGHWTAVDDWYRAGPEQDVRLDDVDVVAMRTDPPFDGNYLNATYLLDQVDDRKVVMVNKPAGLRTANEKLFTLRFPDLIPDTLVTADPREIVSTVRRWGRAVLKPTDGMAGRGILQLRPDDSNLPSILELATLRGTRQVVVQRYLSEADHGDRRIIVLDGEPIGVVRRVAVPGEFRCNMAAGARAVADQVTPQDKQLCAAMAPDLAELGIVFAGIDVIGDRLTEVNVTSPTGIREIDALSGSDLPRLVVEAWERSCEDKRRTVV